MLYIANRLGNEKGMKEKEVKDGQQSNCICNKGARRTTKKRHAKTVYCSSDRGWGHRIDDDKR